MDRIRHLAGALLALICLSTSAASSSTLSWSWRNPLPSADAFTVVAFGGGTYVAAGQDGVIYSSTDGVTWTPATNPAIGVGGQYVDALFANGHFLLAGVDAAGAGHVSTSSDGKLWIDTKLSFNSFDSYLPSLQLGFGNGTYVVMGTGGEATSHDATTWTEHSTGITDYLSFNPILFANGVFVKDGFANPVVTTNDAMYFSSDGVNWTEAAGPLSGVLATDGTTFFAFGFGIGQNYVYTSPDGDHWTKHTLTGIPPERESQVLWDGTQFLAIGLVGTGPLSEEVSYSSPDGIAWTQLSSTQSAVRLVTGLHAIAATGAGYAAAASGALHIQKSSDFFNWNTAFSGSNGADFDLADVIHAGGRFVAVGETPQHGPAVMQSQDGSNWTQPLSGSAGGGLTTVTYGNGLYVAAGAAGWFSSSDASNWTALTKPPAAALGPVMYGNGRFLAFTAPCSATGCNVATSPDGKTWKDSTVTVPHSAVTFDGTRFVSLGSPPSTANAAPVYTSCDGVDWTHSADVDVIAGSSFSSLRPVANGLVATGTLGCQSADPLECAAPQEMIATGEDSSHLTAVAAGLPDDPTDVIYAGGLYYAAIDLDGSIRTSSDGATWTGAVGAPVAANTKAFATDGVQLIAVGNSGNIIAAAVATSPPSSGAACTALPAVSSGSSGGSFDLFTLAGLLGLLLLRFARLQGVHPWLSALRGRG